MVIATVTVACAPAERVVKRSKNIISLACLINNECCCDIYDFPTDKQISLGFQTAPTPITGSRCRWIRNLQTAVCTGQKLFGFKVKIIASLHRLEESGRTPPISTNPLPPPITCVYSPSLCVSGREVWSKSRSPV